MQPLLDTGAEARPSSSSSPPVASMPTSGTDIPMEEQDLTVAAGWNKGDDDDDETPTKSSKWKGKGKAKAVDSDTDEDEPNTANVSPDELNNPTYPPLKEEDREEQRILENLRKWEEVERQKRRLNRDTSISTASAQPTSFIGEATRRASYLWNRGVRTRPSGMGSGSGHKVLSGQDIDDVEQDPSIPLSHVDRELSPSPVTETATVQHSKQPPVDADGYIESPIENPFDDPEVLTRSGSQSSRSTDATLPENESAVMSSQPNTPAVGQKIVARKGSKDSESTSRPVLQATTSFRKSSFQAPPPAPLVLIPPPKTPPPHIPTPRPPSPASPKPLPHQRSDGQDDTSDEPKAPRWWTDWLCGCSEGPDRGGDNQAGRTNPFE